MRNCVIILLLSYNHLAAQLINREAVVKRHNVVVNRIDSLSSLTIGNANFAFTVDATGMQSFPDSYANGVPLGTQSVWGWHSFPNVEGLKIEEAQKIYELEGRSISYTVQLKEPERNRKAVEYFRVNPHRLQLGNIGLEIKKKDGSIAKPGDISNISQGLDLWTGEITSSFIVDGIPVKVVTVCHQDQDVVAFRIESLLIRENRIRVRIRIPYPNGQFKDVGNQWESNGKQSIVFNSSESGASIVRTIDSLQTHIAIRWAGKADAT